MNHDHYEDAYIASLLRSVKTIAMPGASPKTDRPSFGVMRFLMSRGYTVFPVNPGQAGKDILGRTVYATLADLPQPVDMVDVFRAVESLPGVVDEVLAMTVRPTYLWTQLGIRDDAAAERAESAGIHVVMNRCPAIEHPRLIGG